MDKVFAGLDICAVPVALRRRRVTRVEAVPLILVERPAVVPGRDVHEGRVLSRRPGRKIWGYRARAPQMMSTLYGSAEDVQCERLRREGWSWDWHVAAKLCNDFEGAP